MLNARNHQGKFAEDYVRVLASAAGLVVYEDDLDIDGIDLGFRLPTARGGLASSPMVEVQVKSWSAPVSRAGALTYSGLTETQFNRLAGRDYLVPRYLVLVTVPADPARYAGLSTDGLLLRHLAYYRSLAGEPPIKRPDGRRHHPVTVPLGNVLTVRVLRTLVEDSLAPAAHEPDPA